MRGTSVRAVTDVVAPIPEPPADDRDTRTVRRFISGLRRAEGFGSVEAREMIDFVFQLDRMLQDGRRLEFIAMLEAMVLIIDVRVHVPDASYAPYEQAVNALARRLASSMTSPEQHMDDPWGKLGAHRVTQRVLCNKISQQLTRRGFVEAAGHFIR